MTEWSQVPAVARPLPEPEPQPVLAPLTAAAIFLVLTIGPDGETAVRDLLSDWTSLQRAVGFRATGLPLACVAGFSSSAWDRLFSGPRPAELHPFRQLTGTVHRAPCTPGDLIFHVRHERMDLCFEFVTQAMSQLAQAATVVDEVQQLLPRYTVRPLKDFISLMTSSNLPGLGVFVNSMIGLAVAIGFLVIFLSMYTTVTERTREVGTLKALGASKAYIARVILSETTLLCLIGIAAGIGMAYGVKELFLHAFPTLTILITPTWLVKSGAIAVLGGLIGASYPAWVASRKDPVEALAYE